MRLLILGASGGCGRWLTRLAAERGHDVVVLVRASAGFEAPDGVVVHRGDVTDPSALDRALTGRDAVLSALGLRRAGRSPWAPLRSPPDLTERAMRALVPAMGRRGVERIVAISAGGVGDSLARLGWPVRRLVATGNVGVAYRDLERMERVLEESGLDWLAVRPVTLADGEPRRAARPVERYGLTSSVRRSEVAAWMLDAVERPAPFAERRVLLGS
ncbi:MAG TPA: NAD(P)H-binding protein [Gemmatimonadaceae bacterium]